MTSCRKAGKSPTIKFPTNPPIKKMNNKFNSLFHFFIFFFFPFFFFFNAEPYAGYQNRKYKKNEKMEKKNRKKKKMSNRANRPDNSEERVKSKRKLSSCVGNMTLYTGVSNLENYIQNCS